MILLGSNKISKQTDKQTNKAQIVKSRVWNKLRPGRLSKPAKIRM